MDYITDIKIIEGRHANVPVPQGYVKLPLDVNKGAGGRYIYICYKKGPGPRRIVDLKIATASTIFTKDFATEFGYTKINVDLNTGAGGDYIYLFYKKDTKWEYDTDGITDITLVTGQNAFAPAGYDRLSVDLNRGAGGEYIYLCYKYYQKLPPTDLRDWMGQISDNRPIADISIPGTHDSAMWLTNMETTFNDADSTAQTQYLNLENQFDAGVRSFDLRVYWSNSLDATALAHSTKVGASYIGAYSNILFKDAFNRLVLKLKQHPTEFIIMILSVEQDLDKSQTSKYRKEIDSMLKEYRDYIYIDRGEENMDRGNRNLLPTLGEIRGKIFIVSDPIDKGNLSGGYGNDPWRIRYRSDGSKITYKAEKGLTMAQTFQEPYGATGSDRFDQFVSAVQARNTYKEGLLGRFGVNKPWNLFKKTPRQWSLAINPKVLDYLRQHTELTRAGVVAFDFIGFKESQDIPLEVIKVNPELRHYNFHRL
ncbi:MAG: hypothetical protein LKE40_12095 [Spirochaetia bacterium]|jgi:hypothetical protein|nr:hypothetical protein [Spirochaetia bacterium]